MSDCAGFVADCDEGFDLIHVPMSGDALSAVFVCRKRPENTEVITRHQFIRLLAEVLPRAIDQLTRLREDVLQ